MKRASLFLPKNRQTLLHLIYSVSATAIFHIVIQLLVYPAFNRQLGEEQYGVALSILSLVAITAGSCGYAVNCSRILGLNTERTASGDYNRILLGMGILCSLIGIGYLASFRIAAPVSVLLCALLMFTTMLRYYSEVEFRIRADFFRYMIYYILISVGYTVGLLAFRLSGQWMLPLIVGESLGFVYVCLIGHIWRPPFFRKTEHFPLVFSSVSLLLLSILIDNAALHADRILLLAITGDGSAVSLYYVASLVGKVVAMLTVPINSLVISYLARYDGGLTKKLWSAVILAALAFGGISFLGCRIVSPWLIGFLYDDMLPSVTPFFFPAILGQIFYFVSGVLMIILLRFKGEKKQLVFNSIYAALFFACVAAGTILWGLWGFVWAIVLANALRFFAAILWGFGRKRNVKAI